MVVVVVDVPALASWIIGPADSATTFLLGKHSLVVSLHEAVSTEHSPAFALLRIRSTVDSTVVADANLRPSWWELYHLARTADARCGGSGLGFFGPDALARL